MIDKTMTPAYNLIHDVYDNAKFLRRIAERVVVKAGIAPGQCVLDIACGTGWATIAAAQAAGSNGRVTGIDIADKMLDEAKRKTTATGLSNVEYRLEDAHWLPFADASFDAVICSSGIYFLKDIPKALQEWRRVLKTGGKVAFSSFGKSYDKQSLKYLFTECLARYDKEAFVSTLPLARTEMLDNCEELLAGTGFKAMEITIEEMGEYFQDADAYWQERTSMINKPRLERLDPVVLEQFKTEFLAVVESQRTERGIWVDHPVLFCTGKKQP